MKKHSIYWLFNSIRSKFESSKKKYERERSNAEYLLISPTNCGRTWLRLILGKSLQLHFDLAEDRNLFYLYGFSEINSSIPSIKVSHEKYRGYQEYRYRRIILLVRDPRDAVVSKYFGMLKRLPEQNSLDQEKVGLLDYFQNEGLKYYLSFYNEWNQHKSEMRNFLLVRYEDLRENPLKEGKQIMKFLGLNIPDKIISTAIEYASFDNMRKMEAQGQSKSGTLKPGNPQDLDSYKTRKGKVGGFKEYLSAEEVARIEQQINDNLDPYYGYNYYSSDQ